MKLFIPEKEFYVYLHKIDGIIFYIGKGRDSRCVSSHRSKYYSGMLFKKCKTLNDVEVEVLEWFDNEEDALSFERFWIKCAKEDGLELANLLEYHFDDKESAIRGSRSMSRQIYCNAYSNMFKKDIDLFFSKTIGEKYYLSERIKNFLVDWNNGDDERLKHLMRGLDGKTRTYNELKINGFKIGKAKLNNILEVIGSDYKIVASKVTKNRKRIIVWKLIKINI